MKSIIGNLVAILTASGVSIYVFGLVGLTIPVRNMTNDLSTAWYITALVPRIVVAGQGARIWLRWPLIITFSFVLTVYVMQHVYPEGTIWADVILGSSFGGYAGYRLTVSGGRLKFVFGQTALICGGIILGIGAAGLADQMAEEFSSLMFKWIFLLFLGPSLLGCHLLLQQITRSLPSSSESRSKVLQKALRNPQWANWWLIAMGSGISLTRTTYSAQSPTTRC